MTRSIAIVGRPNVGKSSLLNALVGRRVSIVQETPGVTRDRVAVEVEHESGLIELIDTGGIGVVDEMRLDEEIERQIDVALEASDAIIFVVDGRAGVTPLDARVADILRRLAKPTVLAVNKLDHPRLEPLAHEFWSLGLGEPRAVSAKEQVGVQSLLDEAAGLLPPPAEEAEETSETLKIAFVGKRNVGKSTFLNLLAGEERVIVSDIAGTTRDAIDVEITHEGRRFIAIDTAGVMRKSSLNDSIDFYSQVRSEAAIRRADVVLLLLDATREISKVDKKLAALIVDEARPCVIVVNKWDLAPDEIRTGDFLEYLADRLSGLHFAPVVFMSAREGTNVSGAIEVAFDVANQAATRVGTGELNRALETALARKKPGGPHGYKARIYYGTQVAASPPIFSVFVNDPQLFPPDYRRYLENRLREEFEFHEIPIRIHLRRRKSIYHE